MNRAYVLYQREFGIVVRVWDFTGLHPRVVLEVGAPDVEVARRWIPAGYVCRPRWFADPVSVVESWVPDGVTPQAP